MVFCNHQISCDLFFTAVHWIKLTTLPIIINTRTFLFRIFYSVTIVIITIYSTSIHKQLSICYKLCKTYKHYLGNGTWWVSNDRKLAAFVFSNNQWILLYFCSINCYRYKINCFLYTCLHPEKIISILFHINCKFKVTIRTNRESIYYIVHIFHSSHLA